MSKTYTYSPQLTNFFNEVRLKLFGGKLTQKQVDGMDEILNVFNGLDIRYVAYALATAYHETAKTMQPIEEYGKGKNYDYGKKLDMGNGPGKRVAYTTPDKLYYGRGYLQLTWKTNYKNMTLAAQKAKKPWDFVNHPELMLETEPSAWVMRYGMLNGSFTGKKLSDYFNDNVTQPINARRIINGTDQADKIAAYYEVFFKALTA